MDNAAEYSFQYMPEGSIFKFTWKEKLISAERFKEILTLYSSKVLELKPTFLMVDARLNKFTMTNEIQDWHDTKIVPIYQKAGVKAMAFLTPENIFSELTHKKAFNTETAKSSLTTQFFKDEKALLAWFDLIR